MRHTASQMKRMADMIRDSQAKQERSAGQKGKLRPAGAVGKSRKKLITNQGGEPTSVEED